MAKRDYYDILGISKNASPEEIKAAYRQSALKWHPDRNKTPEATEKFKEINEAFEVLSNPEKKTAYDQFGHAAFEPAGFGPSQTYRQGPFTYTYTTGEGMSFEDLFGGFSDPFEIFEQFFGMGQRRRQKPTYSLILDFEDAVKGCEKEVIINNNRQKIKIPAGVDEGSRICFENFDLVVKVKPSEKFKRRSYDLYLDWPISFVQAVLGDTITVPTIDGDLNLKIRPGTKPETVVKLRGRGVPYVHGGGRGDQYVRLNIAIPARLSRRQKEILKEFESESKKGDKGGWWS